MDADVVSGRLEPVDVVQLNDVDLAAAFHGQSGGRGRSGRGTAGDVSPCPFHAAAKPFAFEWLEQTVDRVEIERLQRVVGMLRHEDRCRFEARDAGQEGESRFPANSRVEEEQVRPPRAEACRGAVRVVVLADDLDVSFRRQELANCRSSGTLFVGDGRADQPCRSLHEYLHRTHRMRWRPANSDDTLLAMTRSRITVTRRTSAGPCLLISSFPGRMISKPAEII